MNILKLSAYPTYLLSLLTCTVVSGTAVDVIIVEDTASPCSANEFKCAGSDVCIAAARLCDGFADCDDGSDEENCAVARKCSATEFQCTNRQCISSWRRCDGQYDCDDHSDETAPFCGAESCHPDHFQCENRTGACIPSEWRCDRIQDCADGSDEEDCDPFPCPEETMFLCDNGRCLSKEWRCDGDYDCADGSDEEYCDTFPLGEEFTFLCDNGQYLPKEFRCDGDNDCGDGSDEANCTRWPCFGEEDCDRFPRVGEIVFLCDNGQYVFKMGTRRQVDLVCDGDNDCADGSDEAHCPSSACSAKEFECANGQCIRRVLLCNGHQDCLDGSDEDTSTTCNTTACHGDEFPCGPAGGGCVPEKFRCDGYGDCTDGSDEEDCPVIGSTGEFACNDGQRVPLWSCCDGYANCDDGSDETADVCHALGRCAGNELTCDSPERSCVPATFACDGYEDCVGGFDERNCAVSACSSEEFACKNGQCVAKGSLCDGHLDCEDGSDEHRTICALNTCLPDEFACKNPRGSCVSSELRCNDSVDCEDGSDEMGC